MPATALQTTSDEIFSPVLTHDQTRYISNMLNARSSELWNERLDVEAEIVAREEHATNPDASDNITNLFARGIDYSHRRLATIKAEEAELDTLIGALCYDD